MDEEVRVRLVVGSATGQELAVRLRNPIRQRPPWTAARTAVGANRVSAPALEPLFEGSLVCECVAEHLLVVALKRYETAARGQGNQYVERAASIGPAVDVVAKRDDRVGGSGRGRTGYGGECPGAAVDVTDGDGAGRHGESRVGGALFAPSLRHLKHLVIHFRVQHKLLVGLRERDLLVAEAPGENALEW